MASTRSKNTINDYLVEKDENTRYINHVNYVHNSNGLAFDSRWPLGGSAPPSKMSRDCLAFNPIDIESKLMGIGATNLVNPQKPIEAKIKKHGEAIFFERTPIVMPEPLEIKHGERIRPFN